MKKYSAPEIAVSVFDSASIVTESMVDKTEALEAAKSVFVGMSDVQHTFTVNLGE